MESRSSPAVLLLLVGGALFALGVLAGTWIGDATAPVRAAESAPPIAAGTNELAELRELVESLAAEIRMQRVLERPVPRAAAAPAAPAPAEPVRVSAREPIAPPPSSGSMEEVLARLDRFEQLLVTDRFAPARIEIAVPAGMAVRDYMQALKNSDLAEDVKRAHLLWDMQRVRDAYGPPDEEQDRGDYIEWIYKLPQEGTQFDFHFAGGLVVEAH